MLTLKILTDDELLIALTRAYWELDEKGKPIHNLDALAARFNVVKTSINAIVAAACEAYDDEITCKQCDHQRLIPIRTKYATLLTETRQSRSSSSYSRLRPWYGICRDCRVRSELLERAREEEQARTEQRLIRNWLLNESQQQPMKAYMDASPMEAFLLGGLLRYAGEAWRGDQLDAWERCGLPLCPRQEDIADVYARLYGLGWISPHANSPLEAFSVDAQGKVEFNALRVNWSISPEISGAPTRELDEFMTSRLQLVPLEEMADLWYWVCMNELHGKFHHFHDRFKFAATDGPNRRKKA